MNPEEPLPEPPPQPPSPGGIEGLDPAELLARALDTVQPSAGQTAWIPPEPEELARLLPQYGIESLLGRGGMGAVYKGRQSALDRTVAIKLLPAEIAADEQFIARFRREARTLAKLQHSGIVSIYDFGQTNEGHLYIVMEFVDGTDLHKILRGPGLEPAQALNLISQVCDALHYAHSKDVIHRDIKPGNILVTTDGRVKLADFGLARPIKEESSVLTGPNVRMGTLDYMAPEQHDGHGDHCDQRADIYALGVMLYEMLTGQRPRGAFSPPSHRVHVDIRLDEVVLKAMQQEPERRYQQVSEMKTDVDRIRTTPQPPDNEDLRATEVETGPRPASPAGRPMAMPNQPRARSANPGHPSPDAILKTKSSNSHTMLITGFVALLMLGVVTIFLATRKNGDSYNTKQTVTNTQEEKLALAIIDQLGGKIERDLNVPGKPIVGINMANTKTDDAGLQQIKWLTSVKSINLHECNEVGDAGLAAIGQMENLEFIQLFGCHQISDNGFRYLGGMKKLKSLWIGYTGADSITGSGLTQIKDLTGLKVLSLGHLRVIEDRYLSNLTGLVNLEELYLGNCWKLGDDCLEYVTQLNHLQYLELNDTQVTDSGLNKLKRLRELKTLILTRKLTDAEVADLQKGMPGWKKPQFTDAGVADLQKAMPGLSVILR